MTPAFDISVLPFDILLVYPLAGWRLQVYNSRMIWGLMITDGNVGGIEAELFLTCIFLIKGK